MLRVIAGDFGSNRSATICKSILGRPVSLKVSTFYFWPKKIPRHQIALVAPVTNENKASILRMGGWGAVGGLIAGPLGAAAGMVVGGRKQRVTFLVILRDGKRLIASGSAKELGEVMGMIGK